MCCQIVLHTQLSENWPAKKQGQGARYNGHFDQTPLLSNCKPAPSCKTRIVNTGSSELELVLLRPPHARGCPGRPPSHSNSGTTDAQPQTWCRVCPKWSALRGCQNRLKFLCQTRHFGYFHRDLAQQAPHFRPVVLHVCCEWHCQGCVTG